MGRHTAVRRSALRKALAPVSTVASAALGSAPVQKVTSEKSRMGVSGFLWTTAFLLVSVVDPYSATLASADDSRSGTAVQDFSEYQSAQITVSRGGYQVVSGKAAAIFVEQAAMPDAGSVKAYAFEAGAKYGWGRDQYSCLVKLWNRESHWRVNAYNIGSGAYGIPQALPGIKMASAGEDWMTNPETQINWGLAYISGRYGSPCGALAHSNDFNWY